jgi:hypothetical protein
MRRDESFHVPLVVYRLLRVADTLPIGLFLFTAWFCYVIWRDHPPNSVMLPFWTAMEAHHSHVAWLAIWVSLVLIKVAVWVVRCHTFTRAACLVGVYCWTDAAYAIWRAPNLTLADGFCALVALGHLVLFLRCQPDQPAVYGGWLTDPRSLKSDEKMG